MSEWFDKNDNPVDIPIALKTPFEVIQLYRSIYNPNKNNLPPMVRAKGMNHPLVAILLSAEAEAASKRTKEELLNSTILTEEELEEELEEKIFADTSCLQHLQTPNKANRQKADEWGWKQVVSGIVGIGVGVGAIVATMFVVKKLKN